MCGIFSILGKSYHTHNELLEKCNKGKNRGPEFSTLKSFISDGDPSVFRMGFHRLAINGLDEKSNQPLSLNGCYLVCNGEIYNYKDLVEENGFETNTQSDCEVILHLYKKYGMEYTLRLIDGVFAFVLVDTAEKRAYVARDAFGVRPLFWYTSEDGKHYGFASEMKQLVSLTSSKIEQFKPGTFSSFELDTSAKKNESEPFFYFPFVTRLEIPYPSEYTIYKYLGQIKLRLRNAVKKRVENTDRPIACLLSGGLDSSLITALVAGMMKDVSKLETYSIGLEGSEDLVYAQKVADYLGTKHTSIVATEKEFLDAIPEVIYAIESYDTTTVRASVGNFLVSRYIRKNSDAKVIFNGDGSDELTGGYLYFHKCPEPSEFDRECRRLLKNIHFFDGLRSDRSISYHGLEARTPFLDRSLVEHYLTFPPELRDHNELKHCEKYLLREAFSADKLLPDEILWRTKEAFSDGVSSSKKSWYETIQENIKDDICLEITNMVNPPVTPEQKYYRSIFEKHYPGRGNVIPYFWMPRYTNATDSSARTLDIYSSLVKKEN